MMESETEFYNKLMALANRIQPEAEFVANLETLLINGQKERKMLRLSRYGFGIAAGVALMILLTLAVPPLRTLAQEIIDSLFNQLDSDTTTHSYPRISPRATAEIQIEFTSVEEAEASTNGQIDVVEPAYVPEEYLLANVTLNSDIRPEIREGMYFSNISYERRTGNTWMGLNIMQSSIDLDWGFAGEVGASAAITPISMKWGSDEILAEYVEGNWVPTEKETRDNRVTEVYAWDSTVPIRRLSWSDDNTLYVVQAVGVNPEDAGYIDLDEMVKIAESMYRQ
jgi:hypothetical protein